MTASKCGLLTLLLLAGGGLGLGTDALHASPQSGRAGLTAGNHTIALQHGGRRRSFLVRERPVVLAFHGGGGDGDGFKGYAGLDAVSDREGFIVVYPNGSGALPRRLLTWNAGECCGFAMNQKIPRRPRS